MNLMFITRISIYDNQKTKSLSIYDNQKTKSSMTLPPGPDFATQAILRVHYQCCYYFHYLQEKISRILFQDYGGFFHCEYDFIRQMWFKEDQLPSSLADNCES